MPTIKYIETDGVRRIVTKDEKASCECCSQLFDVLFYPTTTSDGGMSGTICISDETTADAFGFFFGGCWCEGGAYDVDSTRQHIVTDVGSARQDGVWSSSLNFEVNAHWDAEGGTGTGDEAFIDVTYRGITKTASLGNLTIAEYGTNCSGESTGVTITIYATPLPDGSYFEIV